MHACTEYCKLKQKRKVSVLNMARNSEDRLSFEILKDFGSFGEGKWQKHLTYIKWGDNKPKYDVRAWNDDMTDCGKGITLDDAELFDLMSLIEEALDDAGETEE